MTKRQIERLTVFLAGVFVFLFFAIPILWATNRLDGWAFYAANGLSAAIALAILLLLRLHARSPDDS